MKFRLGNLEEMGKLSDQELLDEVNLRQFSYAADCVTSNEIRRL
jgi:hypothetical protein